MEAGIFIRQTRATFHHFPTGRPADHITDLSRYQSGT
jgi:hypothetical protein